MRGFFEALLQFFKEIFFSSWTPPPSLSVAEHIGFVASRVIGLMFLLCYAYQFFYIFVATVRRPRRFPRASTDKRYAVVIAARNEEKVLPALLQALRDQSYPRELLDVYVVADNCTDGTAAVAERLGAHVLERKDPGLVGKGYALQYFFRHMQDTVGICAYDAYFFFDADNVPRPDFVAKMNDAFAAGYSVVTSYRNSKNYGKNWISAGYALWFLREARHLNGARSLLGSSAAITGTGFMASAALLQKNGGWKHFLLTEDIEFTADCVLQGERIGYCHEAEFFDEQPERFGVSWHQRKRWSKGLFQVIRRYGARLLGSALRGKWSSFDMLMSMMPAFLLSSLQLLILGVLFVVDLVLTGTPSLAFLRYFAQFFAFGYVLFFLVGLPTFITEWRRICCNKCKAVLLLFSFPVFMLTYIPVSMVAFCTRVEWRPIRHSYAIDVKEIEGARRPAEKENKK